MSDQKLYNIVRFYRADGRPQKVVKRNLTLDEARAHCCNPSTMKEGVWFDGFESQQANVEDN